MGILNENQGHPELRQGVILNAVKDLLFAGSVEGQRQKQILHCVQDDPKMGSGRPNDGLRKTRRSAQGDRPWEDDPLPKYLLCNNCRLLPEDVEKPGKRYR